jgi:hypothetical protein
MHPIDSSEPVRHVANEFAAKLNGNIVPFMGNPFP